MEKPAFFECRSGCGTLIREGDYCDRCSEEIGSFPVVFTPHQRMAIAVLLLAVSAIGFFAAARGLW